MRFLAKSEALNLEKEKLNEQIKDLQRQHNEDLLKAFEAFPLAFLDLSTLLGGLDFILQKASHDKDQAEVWHQAGQKFCKALPTQKKRKPSKKVASVGAENE